MERLVGLGDFFEPNNEGKLFDKMEAEIEITRKAHLDVADLKKNLNGMTDEVEESKIAEAEELKVLEAATEACEETFRRRDALNLRISKLFVSYERIADTLLPSDLEEVGRMRRPSLPVRAAVFAFGIMLGELDYVKEYPHNDVLDMPSAHQWWPKLAYLLTKSDQTIRKIRAFSLAKLMSDIQAPFLRRARSLYAVLKEAILEEEGIADVRKLGSAAAGTDSGTLEDAPARKKSRKEKPFLHTQHGGAGGSIKKSTVLPDFLAEERRQSRKERKMKKAEAEAEAKAASAKKVAGRPDQPPPMAMMKKNKNKNRENDHAEGDENSSEDEGDEDEDDDDDEGGADSTQPTSIKSWNNKGSRRVLEHMRNSGKLDLPKNLGIKDPWYLESQKKAAQAAVDAAKKADEEAAAAAAAAAALAESDAAEEGDGEGGEAFTPASSAKMQGNMPSESGKRRAFIADVEWDSEADEAGGGEWGPDGEWRPVVKKRKNWWKRPEEVEEKAAKEAQELEEAQPTATAIAATAAAAPYRGEGRPKPARLPA